MRGIPLMDEAAVDALKRSSFEPTLVDGRPAPVVLAVSIRFKLD